MKASRTMRWAAAALLAGATVPVRAAQERPDVVVVVWDATRADHLTPYGYARDTTPNLAAIARGGLVFERAMASGSWTGASAPCLFTGLFTHNNLVDYATKDWVLDLPDAATTFAETFKGAGYRTAIFTGQGVILDHPGMLQGFDLVQRAGEPVLAERALDFIDQAGDAPALVVLWFTNPHAPYLPRAEHDLWSDKSREPLNIVGCNDNAVKKVPGAIKWCDLNWGKVELAPDDYQHLRDLYDGELHQDDAELGELWKGLADRGLADETVFLLTADHGEAFGEHPDARAWHTLPYFVNQHVPLVVRYPKRLAPGRVAGQVRLVDVYPTLADLAGVAVDHPVNGVSLVAAGRDAGQDLPNIGFTHKIAFYNDGRYRLIESRTTDDLRAVYDLRADPGEQHNLAADQPDLLSRLEKAMEDFVAGTHVDLGGQAKPATEEDFERLRALGYVE